MNRDDIIRMAREAGLYVGTNLSGVQLVGGHLNGSLLVHMTVDELEDFAALVAAAEREACARVCETLWDTPTNSMATEEEAYGEKCAAAIRARGKA